jgi:D-alanyl-D-alanine carboxypeptidase
VVTPRPSGAIGHRWTRRLAGPVATLALLTGCSTDLSSPGAPATAAPSTTSSVTDPPTTASSASGPPTEAAQTTTTSTSTTTTSTSTTTASTTSTTTIPPTTIPPTTIPPTTIPPTTLPPLPPVGGGLRIDTPAPDLLYLTAHASTLPAGNLAVAVTIWRDGVRVFGAAAGRTNAGGPVGTDTAFVVASVSKLVTALTVARLVQQGSLDLDAPVPWGDMGLGHDPAWDTVTVRELLAHTSGMPVARPTWLDLPGSCAIPLTDALALPPLPHRGEWTYSNGNYCALGLLVEHVTGLPIDVAAQQLVFDPAGIAGPHLSTLGALPDDAPYTKGVARLERLGGAGTWLASTDDLAMMLAAVTAADLDTLRWPGIMADQYGWGHTGTVDGAKACAWVLDGGRTILTAIVSGNRPATGGGVCDELVPALAVDLGEYAGEPVRTPV